MRRLRAILFAGAAALAPAGLALGAVVGVLGGGAACGPIPADQADALRAVPRGDAGRPVLSLRWRVQTSDRSREVKPQEFATPALYRGHVYVGTGGGTFFALRQDDGAVRWRAATGSVSAQAIVDRENVYVGTDDGVMLCLDAQTGREVWRYATRGPILEPPVIVNLPGTPATSLVVFSNEADQVYALDAVTGEFRWQYKGELPDEYTLRGHAGVLVAGGLVYTGFANGTMVALRLETGSVAWLTSLKGDADRFVDVDATPALLGDTLFATSSAGGVWALDAATGLVRWRAPMALPGGPDGSTGGLILAGDRLFVAVADVGIHALDLTGNVVWRQGTRGGGEPADPVVSGSYLLYALADAGLFVADRDTGRVLQYFDPGDGVSARPVVGDDRLYVLSNRGYVYALDLTRF